MISRKALEAAKTAIKNKVTALKERNFSGGETGLGSGTMNNSVKAIRKQKKDQQKQIDQLNEG